MTTWGPCRRCRQPTPQHRGAGGTLCYACEATLPSVALAERVVDYRMRIQGARFFIQHGYYVAALEVLDGQAWPSVDEAREMQSRASTG